MRHLILISLFAFLISSCSPAASLPAMTATSAPLPTQTSTPAPTATRTPQPTPTATLTPPPTQIGGGSGRLIFDFFLEEYKMNFPNEKGKCNVFVANVDGTNLTPVTNMEGFNFLKGISPDGTKALVVSARDWEARTADLYLVDLVASNSMPSKLATGLPYSMFSLNRTAMWLDNTKLIYVGRGEKGFGIYSINTDGTNPISIERGLNPEEILAAGKNRVYWTTLVDRVRNGNQHFVTHYLWWTNLDGSETGQLKFNGKQIGAGNYKGLDLIFSLDATKMAWIEPATATFHHDYLHIASLSDMDHPQSLDLLSSIVDLKWELDGKSILVFDIGSVPYAKGRDPYGLFEVSVETDTVFNNFNLQDEMMGGVDALTLQCSDISLDGRLLPCLTFGKEKNADGYTFAKLILLNLRTKAYSEMSGFNFLYMNWIARKISWLP